jgi:hypothetical protein
LKPPEKGLLFPFKRIFTFTRRLTAMETDCTPSCYGRDDFREPTVRLVEAREDPIAGVTTVVCSYEIDPRAFAFKCEHEKRTRLFVLMGQDGRTEHFLDNPTKYLTVEPDRETGEPRTAITRCYLAYLLLCREEREVR